MILENMVTHRIRERVPSYSKLSLEYYKDMSIPKPNIMSGYDVRHEVQLRITSSIVAPENMVDFAIGNIVRNLNRHLYGDILEEIYHLQSLIGNEFYISRDSEAYKQISKIKDMLKIAEE